MSIFFLILFLVVIKFSIPMLIGTAYLMRAGRYYDRAALGYSSRNFDSVADADRFMVEGDRLYDKGKLWGRIGIWPFPKKWIY